MAPALDADFILLFQRPLQASGAVPRERIDNLDVGLVGVEASVERERGACPLYAFLSLLSDQSSLQAPALAFGGRSQVDVPRRLHRSRFREHAPRLERGVRRASRLSEQPRPARGGRGRLAIGGNLLTPYPLIDCRVVELEHLRRLLGLGRRAGRFQKGSHARVAQPGALDSEGVLNHAFRSLYEAFLEGLRRARPQPFGIAAAQRPHLARDALVVDALVQAQAAQDVRGRARLPTRRLAELAQEHVDALFDEPAQVIEIDLVVGLLLLALGLLALFLLALLRFLGLLA